MVQGEEPNLLEIEIHLGREEQMFVCGCITVYTETTRFWETALMCRINVVSADHWSTFPL